MLLPWREVSINGGPPIPTSLTAQEGQKLATLAYDAHVLEIGTAYGYSAVVMAQGARHVVTCDPFTDRECSGEGNWGGFGRPTAGILARTLDEYRVAHKVCWHAYPSEKLLMLLAGAHVAFDLIFVDGDHSANALSHDLHYARKLLTPNGTLACHDYGEDSCPDVRTVLDERFGKPREIVDTLWIGKPR